MFTGLVEEIGTIEKVLRKSGGLSISVAASVITEDLKVGDSVNINGVCQTVVKCHASGFIVDTIGETLTKTTLGTLKPKDKVNLERSLTPSSRMGGHFVLGHTDTTGKVIKVASTPEEVSILISYPEKFALFIVNVGSIAIDGVSLTVAEHTGNTLKAAVIPHTWKNTCLQYKKSGSLVNLEFDILGKYALNLLSRSSGSKIDIEMLKRNGFINEEN
jgi:riboflavin synthase